MPCFPDSAVCATFCSGTASTHTNHRVKTSHSRKQVSCSQQRPAYCIKTVLSPHVRPCLGKGPLHMCVKSIATTKKEEGRGLQEVLGPSISGRHGSGAARGFLQRRSIGRPFSNQSRAGHLAGRPPVLANHRWPFFGKGVFFSVHTGVAVEESALKTSRFFSQRRRCLGLRLGARYV